MPIDAIYPACDLIAKALEPSTPRNADNDAGRLLSLFAALAGTQWFPLFQYFRIQILREQQLCWALIAARVAHRETFEVAGPHVLDRVQYVLDRCGLRLAPVDTVRIDA
jgi:hypothetical protein